MPEVPTIIRAAIFDLDGLLVDTEPIHMQAWRAILAPRGVVASDELLRSIIGMSDAVFVEQLLADHGIDGSPGEWLSAKRTAYQDLIRQGVKPFPGAVELLRTLAGRMPIALATSSSRVETDICLGHLDAAGLLTAIVTKDDVTQPKPAPEALLLAARRMGIEPSECAVFEDSLAGVAAAARATMLCIAVTNSFPAASFVCCELILGSLTTTKPVLKLLFGSEEG